MGASMETEMRDRPESEVAEELAAAIVSLPQAREGDAGVVTFFSKSKNHRLVRRPSRMRRDQFGDPEVVPEIAVEFEDGWYRTNHEDTIRWLRNHRSLDAGFAGFVEVAPPAPPATETLKKVALAAVRRDTDALADLYVDEQRGFNREEVIATIREALEGLGIIQENAEPSAPVEEQTVPPHDPDAQGGETGFLGATPSEEDAGAETPGESV